MTHATIDHARGILNPTLAHQKFQICRYLPSPDLAFFVERYWTIRWDLRGQPPFTQETLPYPCINLAIEENHSGVFGIETGKSVRLLENQGRVFGVKFKPGAFYAFFNAPVSNLTNRSLPLSDVFGPPARKLEREILVLDDDSANIEMMEDFLCERLPDHDRTVEEINGMIDCIIQDKSLTSVNQLAQRSGMSKRTIQRIFKRYVGVSPKWVIQRFRLHEVADELDSGVVDDWSAFALRLGYTDQAHFIKDFKAVVGQTPAQYARMVRND
ncbi:MAG: helix-turn-helix domain-containing protein [Chloroflexi bacterium]|nr:helix-turn-helix domain-containing protein [Chloroflexota bacterium]